MGRGFSRGFSRGYLHAAVAELLALEARDVASFSVVVSDLASLDATEQRDALEFEVESGIVSQATLLATEEPDTASFAIDSGAAVVVRPGSSSGGLGRRLAPIGKVRRKKPQIVRGRADLLAVEERDRLSVSITVRDRGGLSATEASDTFRGLGDATTKLRLVAKEMEDTFSASGGPFDVEEHNRLLMQLAA